MNIDIRKLLPEEIEVRVQTVNEKGFSLLLYKDARVDMKILDEVFTTTGWQREHTVVNGNLFCTVSIWDSEKQQWIKKQDVGTESFTEKEKGQASDSFKRACTNVGIGRELYTAPFIWIFPKDNTEIINNKGKCKLKSNLKFKVSKIEYEGDKIKDLVIVDNDGVQRYPNVKNNFTQKFNQNNNQQNQNDNLQAKNNVDSQDDKEMLKTKIVEILNKKNIAFSKVSEYLMQNYNAKNLMDLNLNQIKILAHKIEFEWR